MNVIKVIKNLNKAETAYYEAKRELELTKADLQLHTEWSEVLDKPKPTVAEKDSWIALQTKDLQAKVDGLKIRRDYLHRLYKVAFLE